MFLMIITVCGTNISNQLKAAGLGDTSTAGIATAVQMAGGFSMGLVFNRLSAKLKDYALALTFFIVFVGYTIINIGQSSLIAVLVGIFIVGTAISIIIPQSLFSTSNRVIPRIPLPRRPSSTPFPPASEALSLRWCLRR
jgi:hypothetical protein